MDELFIYQTIQTIIGKSTVMQGHFFIAPAGGNDLNSNNLGQLIDNTFTGDLANKKKYPMCLMLPPLEKIHQDRAGNISHFVLRMFFLTPSYYSSNNQIKGLNSATQTSNHPIWYTWKDMRECAVNFINIWLQATTKTIAVGLRDGQDDFQIDRVSEYGNDKASGVLLTWRVQLSVNEITPGCTLTDYTPDNISAILDAVKSSLTNGPIHPLHLH